MKNMILPSCDQTLLKVCSSLVFSNILILFPVNFRHTNSCSFQLFLISVCPITDVISHKLNNSWRRFGIFENLGLPRLCDLSISSGLIVSSMFFCSALMTFLSTSSTVSCTIPCTKRQLSREY